MKAFDCMIYQNLVTFFIHMQAYIVHKKWQRLTHIPCLSDWCGSWTKRPMLHRCYSWTSYQLQTDKTINIL